jgi:hypothetical protein
MMRGLRHPSPSRLPRVVAILEAQRGAGFTSPSRMPAGIAICFPSRCLPARHTIHWKQTLYIGTGCGYAPFVPWLTAGMFYIIAVGTEEDVVANPSLRLERSLTARFVLAGFCALQLDPVSPPLHDVLRTSDASRLQ